MRWASTVLCCMLAVGCDAANGSSAEAEIREAALRWAFANAETTNSTPAVYCVADAPTALAAGTDPDAAFLARFEDSPIPVRALSSCFLADDSLHAVVDGQTGRYGLLFTISPVDWEGRTTVEVGFIQGGHWGAAWECTLERISREWVVARCDRMVGG